MGGPVYGRSVADAGIAEEVVEDPVASVDSFGAVKTEEDSRRLKPKSGDLPGEAGIWVGGLV